MAELEAARQRVMAARAASDRIPDPTLGLRAYSEDAGAETGLAVTFSMPLGVSGRSAAADAQSARADAALAQLARVRREFERRAQADVLRANASFASWQEAAKAHEASLVARERTQRGYEAGEFDLSEMLLIARQAFDAERAELAARSAAQRAILHLQIDAHELWVLHDETD